MIASTKKHDFRQPMFLCTFIPEPLSNSAHISTKYEQALLAPTHFRGQNNSHMSLYTPMPTPTSARDSYRHAHADDASIHSFASAPTPTMIRPPTSQINAKNRCLALDQGRNYLPVQK